MNRNGRPSKDVPQANETATTAGLPLRRGHPLAGRNQHIDGLYLDDIAFSQNLSHRLVHTLADEYPGSTHVRDVGLRGAEDRQDHRDTFPHVTANHWRVR